MTFLPKGTFALYLLAASAAIGTVSAADFDVLTDEEAVEPFDLWDSGATKTLLVSYQDDAAHTNVQNLAKKMKGQGKEIKERSIHFGKAHKMGKAEKLNAAESRVEADDGNKGKPQERGLCQNI